MTNYHNKQDLGRCVTVPSMFGTDTLIITSPLQKCYGGWLIGVTDRNMTEHMVRHNLLSTNKKNLCFKNSANLNMSGEKCTCGYDTCSECNSVVSEVN